MRKFNRYQNTISRIIIMSAAGCLLIFFAGRFQPAALASVPEAGQEDIKQIAALSKNSSAYFVSRTVDACEDYLDTLSRKIEHFNSNRQSEDIKEEYIPSVLQYNLVRLFPETSEKADTSANMDVSGETVHSVFNNPSELADLILTPLYQKLNLPVKSKVRDSYGGQMYEYLNRKDAEWTSNLYKWIQAAPAKAAAMKSMSSSTVLGKYNPNDKKHKADEPGTWLVPAWKNVSVSFYDGDGRQTELYSNTREILSMASVNTYYMDWQNTEEFERYIDSLWKASHSFGTKISKVYYCDGCETPPESNAEAAEESVKEGAESTEAALAAGDSQKVNHSAPADLNAVRTDPAALESTAPAGTAAVSAAVESSAVESSAAGSSAVGSSAVESSAVESSPSENIGPANASDVQSTKAPNLQETALAAGSAAPLESSAMAEGSSAMAEGSSAAAPSDAAPSDAAPPDAAGQETAKPQIVDLPAVNQGVVTSALGAVAQVSANVKKEPEIILNSAGKFCPGHVDLSITARITGLSEQKNLFSLDKTAPHPWNGYMKSYANELNSMDWSEEYGLSAMELGMGKPLTSSEIAEYLNTLPAETSPERKAVVAYALNSVGKIPYYYGGKPRTSGYENNNFSTPMLPDQKGRVLSGLDCSGWINWVYWSSINKRLSSLGTSGLIHEGRAIRRSELKPGDILVKPGLNSHVVMFLSWAPDNTMVCIHETGGTVSNVTVSTMGTNWPYYRAILD